MLLLAVQMPYPYLCTSVLPVVAKTTEIADCSAHVAQLCSGEAFVIPQSVSTSPHASSTYGCRLPLLAEQVHCAMMYDAIVYAAYDRG